MKINDIKPKLIGLLAILCVIIFAYSILNIVEQSNMQHIKSLEEMNKSITENNDSTKIENSKLTMEVKEINERQKEQNEILSKFQKSYDQNLLEIKQIKNEKNFVPTNISSDDQYIYVSEYQYKEY